jgi:hypothetical protein
MSIIDKAGACVALAATLLLGGSAHAALTRAERKCIDSYNQ